MTFLPVVIGFKHRQWGNSARFGRLLATYSPRLKGAPLAGVKRLTLALILALAAVLMAGCD